jgi:hypothetical protein
MGVIGSAGGRGRARRYSVCLRYWYKSTYTDAAAGAAARSALESAQRAAATIGADALEHDMRARFAALEEVKRALIEP